MPDEEEPRYPDPRKEDIMAGDRRISRPDSSMPDWYIPDVSYRPIPIAWFAAAVLIQTVVMTAIFIVLFDKSGWLTVAFTGLASLGILLWSWERGIGTAGRGWQTTTIAVMTLQFLLVCIGASVRI